MRKLADILRKIKYGIENLIIWFPIIWKDRPWDHYFIYCVLRRKLHLTEQYIRKYGLHVKNIEDADKIKKCVLLLDRLIKDEYHDHVFKNHYKKWGEPNYNFEGNRFNIDHPNVKTARDKELHSKEFRRLIEEEDKHKNQDLDLLFKLMRKHIQTWWD